MIDPVSLAQQINERPLIRHPVLPYFDLLIPEMSSNPFCFKAP